MQRHHVKNEVHQMISTYACNDLKSFFLCVCVMLSVCGISVEAFIPLSLHDINVVHGGLFAFVYSLLF